MINLTFYKKQAVPSKHSLRPTILGGTSSFRITAAAGTKLARASSLAFIIILTSERTLQPTPLKRRIFEFYSFKQYYWIKLSFIVQDSPLLAKPGPCLSSGVADHSLKPAKDRRLCKPLPYQQANLFQAYPKAAVSLLFRIKQNFWVNFSWVLLTYAPLQKSLTSMC
jgi:hypothetical protein